MNVLLKQALAEIERLPDAAQESIASLILQEIADERQWDEAFAVSQDQLGELVRRARAEVAEDGAETFDPSDRPE
jgi:hypothetical protein